MDFQQFLNDSDELHPRGLFNSWISGWEQMKTMVKSVDMKQLVSLVMTFVAFVKSQEPVKVIQGIGEGIQKEVVAVKTPIDETIAYVGSSQCTNVKKLFGVTYEQLEGEREPDVNQLRLVYKTRSFNRSYSISTAAEELLQARAFDYREKVVIFVHGFTDDPSKESFTNISESVLQSEEGDRVTLLALDGSSLIRWLYIRASTNVIFMGQKLAEVLVTLVKLGLDPSQIHMVGHSLGAHVSGFTGKQFYELTGKKIGRISGLDPAGPCFTHVEVNLRLQKTDAEAVDVIHCDGGVYGIKAAVGHSDYYPNEGVQQPNCFFQTCSHSRCWLLYGESILRKDAFPALRCDSWENYTKGQCYNEISLMGYASKPGTTGLFFLQTGGKYPYGLGFEGLKYNNNVGILRNAHDVIGKVPVIKNLPVLG